MEGRIREGGKCRGLIERRRDGWVEKIEEQRA